MQIQYRGMNLIIPENDTEWKGYFEAARDHRLVMKQCRDCGRLRYPPGRSLPVVYVPAMDLAGRQREGYNL
jgi:uncharacterized OB-fold protein